MKKSNNKVPKYTIIISECIKQSETFIKWAKQQKWSHFHSAHYDWWAFPIDKSSMSKGTAYKVGEQEYQKMYNNQQFIQALRNNSILVCKSWGWDIINGKDIVKNIRKQQRWQRWPIRLSKMCRSLQIFKQRDLFINAIKYANILLKQYKKFTYAGKDLTPYFIKNHQQILQQKNPQKQQQQQSNEKNIKYREKVPQNKNSNQHKQVDIVRLSNMDEQVQQQIKQKMQKQQNTTNSKDQVVVIGIKQSKKQVVGSNKQQKLQNQDKEEKEEKQEKQQKSLKQKQLKQQNKQMKKQKQQKKEYKQRKNEASKKQQKEKKFVKKDGNSKQK